MRKANPLIWSRVWYEPIPANFIVLKGKLDEGDPRFLSKRPVPRSPFSLPDRR
jgi:hypothetical protein